MHKTRPHTSKVQAHIVINIVCIPSQRQLQICKETVESAQKQCTHASDATYNLIICICNIGEEGRGERK
jgi:hypothetical protein